MGSVREFAKRLPAAVPVFRFIRRQGRKLHGKLQALSGNRVFDRSRFDALFEVKRDPWAYDSTQQQIRFKALLESIPAGPKQILEAGCAEGMFTLLLSQRAGHLVAFDISAVAIRRAKHSCDTLSNVHFLQCDVASLPFLPEQFDVVVCAGILVYLPEKALFRKTSIRLVDLIKGNGFLVLEHLWESPGAELEGRRIHDHFCRENRLELLSLRLQDEYGISVFRKISDS
jgi:SAM-dependent methyltransferase